MKYIRRVKFNILVPFKTISVNEAPNLKRIFDSVGFDDTLFSDLTKLLTDNISYSDHEIKDMSKLITSAISTADEIIIEIDFRRSFADSIDNISDTRTLHPNLGKFDSVNLNDTSTIIAQFRRNLYDSLGFIHQLAKNSEKLLPSDPVTMTDTLNRSVVYYRAQDDSFVMSDSISTKNTDKGLSETVTCIDSFGRVVVFNRVLNDVFAFEDRISSKNISKVLNSYIIMSDNMSLSNTSGKQFDWMDISDTKSFNLRKYFPEEVSMFDAITGKSLSKVSRDDINLTEQFIKNVTFIRSYDDSVNLTEQISSSYSSTKQDIVDSYIENTRISTGTYVDPQYYDPDYIAGITAYIKTVSDNLSITDTFILVRGKNLYSNNTNMSDLGGAIVLNSYMDSQYISQNYIGTLNIF